ncbi:MAG: hydrogenase maturation peptidase HycI [Ruminiclostridium sp.]|jgi:hydrogenase 3 maturation protease|nr:hydrogenase maturation peptidase HycI [Ruminiclostridium sp.]
MDVRDYLRKSIQPKQKIALLGVGSTLRSDDAAGMYFIELLEELLHQERTLLISGSTAPENFTGVIKEFAPDKLFIVDAAHMGLLPGEVKPVPASDIGGVSFSTHMLPIPVMLKYLESEAGCEVVFIGIQPKSIEQGLSMCEEVKRGTEQLVKDFYDVLTISPEGQH